MAKATANFYVFTKDGHHKQFKEGRAAGGYARKNEGILAIERLTPGPTILPSIFYHGKWYWIDFRLEELRTASPSQPLKVIRFVDLSQQFGDNELKTRLRELRSRVSHSQYMKGLDD